jgi:hypothetical protein
LIVPLGTTSTRDPFAVADRLVTDELGSTLTDPTPQSLPLATVADELAPVRQLQLRPDGHTSHTNASPTTTEEVDH